MCKVRKYGERSFRESLSSQSKRKQQSWSTKSTRQTLTQMRLSLSLSSSPSMKMTSLLWVDYSQQLSVRWIRVSIWIKWVIGTLEMVSKLSAFDSSISCMTTWVPNSSKALTNWSSTRLRVNSDRSIVTTASTLAEGPCHPSFKPNGVKQKTKTWSTRSSPWTTKSKATMRASPVIIWPKSLLSLDWSSLVWSALSYPGSKLSVSFSSWGDWLLNKSTTQPRLNQPSSQTFWSPWTTLSFWTCRRSKRTPSLPTLMMKAVIYSTSQVAT